MIVASNLNLLAKNFSKALLMRSVKIFWNVLIMLLTVLMAIRMDLFMKNFLLDIFVKASILVKKFLKIILMVNKFCYHCQLKSIKSLHPIMMNKI
jgi:hypothetical protein